MPNSVPSGTEASICLPICRERRLVAFVPGECSTSERFVPTVRDAVESVVWRMRRRAFPHPESAFFMPAERGGPGLPPVPATARENSGFLAGRHGMMRGDAFLTFFRRLMPLPF